MSSGAAQAHDKDIIMREKNLQISAAYYKPDASNETNETYVFHGRKRNGIIRASSVEQRS
jgi:hypothetical protein